jgi:hypothetical protein
MNSGNNPMTKEKPILFSAPMVRAILSGAKTQTRRVVKPGHKFDEHFETCPYGQPGDRLWVKETWQDDPVGEWGVCYRASGHNEGCKFPLHLWRPSIFMPRKLSRITLEITDVRVQRVQEISDDDATAEGCEFSPVPGCGDDDKWCHGTCKRHGRCMYLRAPRFQFQDLWDSLNAKRGYGWKENPWVWAITFKRLTP